MKKAVLFILLIIGTILTSFAQNTVSAVSKSGYVNISKDPPKPAYLEISGLQFIDTDGNNKIDASEKSMIYFNLSNSGLGPGLNLKVSLQELNNSAYLNFDKLTDIGKLDVGQTVQIQIPVESDINLKTGIALFKIKIEEANGNDSDPVEIEVETKAFRAPKVEVADYKVSSQYGEMLTRRRPFNVQVLIQNVGEGNASTVGIELQIPKGVFCLSGNENQVIGNLESGEQHLVEYELYANNEYPQSTIPLNILLSEKYGKYASNKNITLTMNQGVSSEKLVVHGKAERKTAISVASLSSKVDKNIPYNPNKNPNRIALIIGNEDYSRTLNAEVNVDYARNDAETFRQYALNVMGVEKRNIHFLLNATAGQMHRQINLVAAILQKLGNRGELIFYYAGHGYPDEVTKIPYIIPVDVDATNLGSAIKLSEVYKKFSNTGAAKITIFLDACFSGGGRNQGLLAARSVAIKPKKEAISGNMVVFSATTDKQSALPYRLEQHGMFTYYLLKALQDSKGTITYKQLDEKLREEVGIESLRINGKPQDPTVSVSPTIDNEWKTWNFR